MSARSSRGICATKECGHAAQPGSPWCKGCKIIQDLRTTAPKQAADTGDQLDMLAPTPVLPVPLGSTTGPRARRGDRATSHAATRAASRGLTGKQRVVLSLFRLHGDMHDEALVADYKTERHRQLMVGAGLLFPDLTDSSIRTRRAELVTLGRLRDSGRTTTTQRGGETTVWELAPWPPETEQPDPERQELQAIQDAMTTRA